MASATMESGSPRMLFSSDRDEFTATKKKKLSGRARIRISSGRFRHERASGRREVGRLTESLVLLLEGHDPRREQAPETEAVALRHGERRVLRPKRKGSPK